MNSLLINNLKLQKFIYKWRQKNKHNKTKPVSVFPMEIVKVGVGTYGRLDIETYGTKGSSLTIGSYCSIAKDVLFLCDGEHDYSRFSTYPFRVYYGDYKSEARTKGPIVIKDDVWIGTKCLILSGVTVGQGAVIAAGSIVYKNVPPYAIYALGKIIKYRFSEDIISKLLKFDYSNINDTNVVLSNMDTIYKDIDEFLESEFYMNNCYRE